MSEKKRTTFYVSDKVWMLMNYYIELEEIPQTLFLKRAIQYFLDEGNYHIDRRILINQRKNPEYIKREKLVSAYLDCEQYMQITNLANKMRVKPSQVIFQVLVNYCAYLAAEQ